MLRSDIFDIFDHASGNVPASALRWRYKVEMSDQEDQAAGNVPLSEFKYTEKYVMEVEAAARECGSVPCSMLVLRLKVARFVKELQSSGIVPVRLLFARTSDVTSGPVHVTPNHVPRSAVVFQLVLLVHPVPLVAAKKSFKMPLFCGVSHRLAAAVNARQSSRSSSKMHIHSASRRRSSNS